MRRLSLTILGLPLTRRLSLIVTPLIRVSRAARMDTLRALTLAIATTFGEMGAAMLTAMATIPARRWPLE
jgi:hypothetical protein